MKTLSEDILTADRLRNVQPESTVPTVIENLAGFVLRGFVLIPSPQSVLLSARAHNARARARARACAREWLKKSEFLRFVNPGPVETPLPLNSASVLPPAIRRNRIPLT
jgi:hypothetical protein